MVDTQLTSPKNSTDSTRLLKQTDEIHSTIQNAVEDARNTLVMAESYLPRVSSITSKLSSMFTWVSESPLGGLFKRAGVPVLAGIKGANALDALEHHDGHAIARSGGSFLATVAAGMAAGAVGGFFLGGGVGALPFGVGGAVAAGLGYIGVMHFSDDMGGQAADAAIGNHLQAGQNARINEEMRSVQKRIQKIEQKSQTHDLNMKDNLALFECSTELKRLLDDQVGAVKSSGTAASALEKLNMESIQGELAAIKKFSKTHGTELARPIELLATADLSAGKDSFEHRIPQIHSPTQFMVQPLPSPKGRGV